MGHTLKGACATAGAVSMQNIAYQIEVAAKSGAFITLVPLVRKLEQEFEKLSQTFAGAGYI